MPDAGDQNKVNGVIRAANIEGNSKLNSGDNVLNFGYRRDDHGDLVPFPQNIKYRLREIAREAGIPIDRTDDFCSVIEYRIEEFKSGIVTDTSLTHPVRDYRRGEDLIEYLRSNDGFGPWIRANKLTRPIIRDLAPGAYMALANYLRRNELPADIIIPKKSEVLDNEEISAEALRAARRLIRRAERRGVVRE